jgi:hypothetical protein
MDAAAPEDTNMGVNVANGNLPSPQAIKLPAGNSSTSTQRREASKVKAAQKKTTGPSTRDFS